MGWILFFTIIGAAVAVIGVIYQFFRNFKADIKLDMNSFKNEITKKLDHFETRMDQFEIRKDRFEQKMISLEERMFWMATGKRLEDAILEERLKNPKTNP